MKHCVFIHTNPKQIVGAIVAEHALRRSSTHNDQFDVRIIDTRDHGFLGDFEGKLYLRDGVKRIWLNDDLQSFTPLRFMPPELMGYQGRAVVIDPDIFALADVWDLLTRIWKAPRSCVGAAPAPKGWWTGASPPASCFSTVPSSPTGAARSSSAPCSASSSIITTGSA